MLSDVPRPSPADTDTPQDEVIRVARHLYGVASAILIVAVFALGVAAGVGLQWLREPGAAEVNGRLARIEAELRALREGLKQVQRRCERWIP